MLVFALSLSCCVLIRTSCPSWGMDAGVIRPPIHPARQHTPTAHGNIILLPCSVCKKVNSTVKEIQEIQEGEKPVGNTPWLNLESSSICMYLSSWQSAWRHTIYESCEQEGSTPNMATLRWSLPVCLSVSATTSLPFCWTHIHTYLKTELQCSIMFY